MKIHNSILQFKLPSRFHSYFLLMIPGVFLLFFFLYTLTVNRVELLVDGGKISLTTTASTVEQVLKVAGLTLQPGDEVTPGLKEKIRGEETIEVLRGVNLSIVVDGEEITTRMPPVKVEEALARTGVELGENDRVSLPLGETVWEGLRLKITRVTSEELTVQYKIAPKVSYINDPNLDKGKQRTVQKGEPGVLERKYTVVYEDGEEIKRTKTGEKVIKPAVKQVIARGTRPVVKTLTVARGITIRYTEMKIMEATAYDPGPESCGIYADGYTYTGKKATYGIAAVDPKVIPLGTKLYVEGYGFADAEDIGSAIKNNRIDLCFDTQREAILFGRKKVKVYILAP
ncbi:MAG: DUF348 domain-containing protein [Firmicutes bacterium]|nr:DUF348 domain-containing protein [Bacillota bacterium]